MEGENQELKLPSIHDQDIEHKTVLLRFDGDVPVRDGKIIDDYRLKAVLPTIQFCFESSARILLLCHRGRPKSKKESELSNAIVADYLGAQLNEPVPLVTDVFTANKLGRIQLFENLRYYPGEEKNDKKFAKQLATLGQVYCNDAFAVSHRSHASVSALPQLLPHVAGLSLLQEIDNLTPLRQAADPPYVAILGGAKVEDKSPILEDMIDRCTSLLIGGLVAITYLKAMNHYIGAHVVDQKQLKLAQHCIRKAHEKKVSLYVPVDFVNQKREVKPITHFEDGDLMLDIGPETQASYDRIIHRANTIFWNGAMGKSEEIAFARGTIRLAHSIGISGADTRIASGGDTVGAIHEHKLHKAFTFLSAGGGATLEFVAGKALPGLQALLT